MLGPSGALVAETGAGKNDGDLIIQCEYDHATAAQRKLAHFADEGDSDIPQDGKCDGDDPYVLG